MNLCVFSRDLLERYKLRFGTNANTDDEFKEIVTTYFTNYNIEPYIICDPQGCIDEEVNQRLLYECAINPKLRQVLSWVTKKVLAQITTDSLLTFCVKLRIFTSMLNKLTFSEQLDINSNSIIHFNVTQNLWGLRSDINSSELPF